MFAHYSQCGGFRNRGEASRSMRVDLPVSRVGNAKPGTVASSLVPEPFSCEGGLPIPVGPGAPNVIVIDIAILGHAAEGKFVPENGGVVLRQVLHRARGFDRSQVGDVLSELSPRQTPDRLAYFFLLPFTAFLVLKGPYCAPSGVMWSSRSIPS